MSCSPARLTANQRNTLKSTGPKSPEGKTASRLNAFKHGLAGEGTLFAPAEDAKLIEHRAKVFFLPPSPPNPLDLSRSSTNPSILRARRPPRWVRSTPRF